VFYMGKPKHNWEQAEILEKVTQLAVYAGWILD
jgi:hypothetical protein